MITWQEGLRAEEPLREKPVEVRYEYQFGGEQMDGKHRYKEEAALLSKSRAASSWSVIAPQAELRVRRRIQKR